MPSPRLLLAEHHHALDAACVSLRTSAFTDDPLAVIVRYRELEHAVNVHMRAEEQEVLPAYADAVPADAAMILATHEELRQKLYRLGVEAELHSIRLESIDALIAALREHAAHEERTLYPWAEEHMTLSARRTLFQAIGTSLKRLSGRGALSPVARVHS